MKSRQQVLERCCVSSHCKTRASSQDVASYAEGLELFTAAPDQVRCISFAFVLWSDRTLQLRTGSKKLHVLHKFKDQCPSFQDKHRLCDTSHLPAQSYMEAVMQVTREV